MSVRVLHVIASLETGGAETALVRICQAATAFGIDSKVLVLGRIGPLQGDLGSAGVSVLAPRLRPDDLPRLLQLPIDWPPQVIHGWMYHGNLAACLLRTTCFPKAALAWNIRCGLDTPNQYRPRTRALIHALAGCSRVPEAILYNANSARTGHEAMGYAASGGEVIPNGFDTDAFHPDRDARVELRSGLGLGGQIRLVGLVARFHPEKNPGLFLEALSRLPDTVHGLMVGAGMARENATLTGHIHSVGLSSRVHLLGERRDLPRILPALDVAVSASWNEGFSNALGEAQAAGVPCVATAVGDSPRLVGGVGRLVPPGDVEAMAAAIAGLLDLPEMEREALGWLGRQRMMERYGLCAVAGRYSELYRRLADRL